MVVVVYAIVVVGSVRVCASGVWQHAAPPDSRCCISRWCACAIIRRVSLRACVRACNGIDGRDGPAVGIRRSAGAASREMRDPWNRTVTAANRSYQTSPHPDTPTTPSHSTTAPPGQGTPPPTSSTCPIHLPKGPFSWCPRACVRMHVAHAAAPWRGWRAYYYYYNGYYIIFLLYIIQYNDDVGAHTPRSPRYRLETVVNYTEYFIN